MILALGFVSSETLFGYALWWCHVEDLRHDGFEWCYRSKYFPVKGDGCGDLERVLTVDANSPQILLTVFEWEYDSGASKNPYHLDRRTFYDVRHQALVRLLALQKKEFGTKAPPQSDHQYGIDHSGVSVLSVNKAGDYLIEGTGSIFPDHFGQHPWEGYYHVEQFLFDSTGKLLDRGAKL